MINVKIPMLHGLLQADRHKKRQLKNCLFSASLSVQDNNYKLFKEQLEIFRSENVEKINESLISVEQHLSIIENDFSGILDKLEMIRENRFLDKLLWTKGRSHKNGFGYNS